MYVSTFTLLLVLLGLWLCKWLITIFTPAPRAPDADAWDAWNAAADATDVATARVTAARTAGDQAGLVYWLNEERRCEYHEQAATERLRARHRFYPYTTTTP